ncbi:hypothetical protein KP803_20965 [Vibrio sp. ZSDE26]|uniref:Lipoprotein n=1 Tax=Vibrio amylolyticus TaxID=2847292 RepID=A0A9X1XUC2_9VIBR|nr:hypothetical protein [Vibrio amylolyticus]MCK6265734.1 hypothetical protein [Vibrio amylolyticus]
MNAFKLSALLLSLAALQACSTNSITPEPVEPIKATLEKPETIQPQTFVLRGEVVLGHEVSSIKPCGSNKQLWLALDQTQNPQASQLVRSPYQPLYGEVIGHLVTPNQYGFDSDFDARFVVDQINFLTAENPNRCDQPIKPTRVFGLEPNWSGSFKNNAFIFQRMGFDAQSMKIESSTISVKQREYHLDNGHLLLEESLCNDTMSDSLYGWKANLTIGEQHYQGCATLSNKDATQGWSGVYHATSTQSTNFSVEMALFSDHTATTRYDYNNGEPAIVEAGFWQQLNPDQVQVVMTHHQRQVLRSERIFTRDNTQDTQQLNATHEKIGDVVYPIANGGLTLYSISPAE